MSITRQGPSGTPRSDTTALDGTGLSVSSVQVTKQGLSGTPRALLGIVAGTAACALSLAAPAMSGNGTSTTAQVVTGSGAFSKTLATPTQASSGTTLNVDGSGAFALTLAAPTSSGSGIANVVVVGTGDFQASDLAASQTGVGDSTQGVFSTGSTVEWGPLYLVPSSAGAGAVIEQPDAVGLGDFSLSLAAPIYSSVGISTPPQQVTATGSFVAGDLAAPVQSSHGDANPEGTISGQGFGQLGGTLDASQSGTGTVDQTQQAVGVGAFSSGNLEATQTGDGFTSGNLGTGAFSLDLTASSVGTGIANAPPPSDLGWEDDDVTWGGLQLTSTDAAPVGVSDSAFYIIGQDKAHGKTLSLIRNAAVYEVGQVVLGHKVILDIDGPSGYVIGVYLGSHQNVDDAIDWEGPYDFEIGKDSFVDFAVSGKYLALRISSYQVPTWTLQSYTIEYEIVGRN